MLTTTSLRCRGKYRKNTLFSFQKPSAERENVIYLAIAVSAMRAGVTLLILMMMVSTLSGCLGGDGVVGKTVDDVIDKGEDGNNSGDEEFLNGTGEDNSSSSGLNTSQSLGPIQVIMSTHIEGWNNDATNAEAFAQHVARTEVLRTVLEDNGIMNNWEIRPDQFLAGVVNHESDILEQWQNSGHAVEIHADLGGDHDNDERLSTELGEYIAAFNAAGLNVTSASGMCSEADWVSAASENGLKMVDGIVEYCLKSMPPENLPSEYAWIEDCTTPSDCHTGVFHHDLERSMTPWRPISAENWVMPGGNNSMPIILGGGPWNGTLACMAEDAGIKGDDCVRDLEDTLVFDSGLQDMLAARQPGVFYGFIIGAASIGGSVNESGMRILVEYLAGQVEVGNIEFITAEQFVSRYEHWEVSGDVPQGEVAGNGTGSGDNETGEVDVHEWKDLTYASVGAIDLKLDLYVPESPGPHPLIIFIHPGAFFMGDKKDLSTVPGITTLYDNGNGSWAVASINYRLSDEAIWPAQIQDCKAAVRWLRASAEVFNIDPDMFVAWGNSAGGMLAVMLEVTEGSAFHEDLGMGNANVSSDVQAVVDWYGPVDALLIQYEASLETDPTVPPSPHAGLLGCDYDNCSWALMESATARTMVDGNESPILIMHGLADAAVNVTNSMHFESVLSENGSNYTIYFLLGVGHGSDAAWKTTEEYGKAHSFLAWLLEDYYLSE